jgi:phage terminase small subunit
MFWEANKMGNPRKPIAAQTSDRTKKVKNERKQSETAVDQSLKDGFDKIPEDLVNDDAVKAWKDWIEYLKGIGFYGNVTVPELIGYCNAWAMNIKAQRKLKRCSVDTADKYANTIKKYSEEMTRCMNRGGFSVNARLHYAETTFKSEMEEISSEFGI